MLIHLEDRRLVKRLLAGDQRAFNQFFDENFPRLYRFAVARLPEDPETVREVVQTSLSKALANLRRYRGEAALFTWLCAICRNELVDRMRASSSYREHVLLSEDRPEIAAAVAAAAIPEDLLPEQRYGRHEICRLVPVALDQLPPHYGNALEWKYIEGRSVAEIAERLGVSKEAAQSVLARSKRSFREVFAELAETVLPEYGIQRE